MKISQLRHETNSDLEKILVCDYWVIVKSLYAQKKDSELTAFLKKIDASKGIYGNEFTFFLGSLNEIINDFKRACVCYHTSAESYVIMEEKIPTNIELKLKNCKQ